MESFESTAEATAPNYRAWDWSCWVLLAVTLVVGVALRLVGIASFDVTYMDVTGYQMVTEQPSASGPFSLYYVLMDWSVESFGVQPWSIRLPAVVFGILALPVAYACVRQAFGPRTALFTTVLIAFSHWHVEQGYVASPETGVFLCALVFFCAFLRFVQVASWVLFFITIMAGLLALSLYAAASLMFLPVVIYALLAQVWWPLLPHRSGQRRLLLLAGLLLAGVLLTLPQSLPLLDQWLQQPAWVTNSWVLVPLLAINLLSIPLFLAVLLGLYCLYRQPSLEPEFLLLTLGMVSAILVLAVMGQAMNIGHNVVFSLVPLFFIAAGEFCAEVYHRHQPRMLVLALAPVMLLVSTSTPELLSYFIDQRSLSEREVVANIIDSARPGDIIYGNVGHGLLDFGELERMASTRQPFDNSVAWAGLLNNLFADNQQAVWFAWRVPRTGMSLDLKRWLAANTELIYEQRAGRIDRRERTVSVWRKPPVTIPEVEVTSK